MTPPFSPGDLVEVIDARPRAWHEPKDHHIAKGDVMTVDAFSRAFPLGWGFPNAFVRVRGRRGKVAQWDAYRFRKIDDEVTEEFREQLRTIRTPALANSDPTP